MSPTTGPSSTNPGKGFLLGIRCRAAPRLVVHIRDIVVGQALMACPEQAVRPATGAAQIGDDGEPSPAPRNRGTSPGSTSTGSPAKNPRHKSGQRRNPDHQQKSQRPVSCTSEPAASVRAATQPGSPVKNENGSR